MEEGVAKREKKQRHRTKEVFSAKTDGKHHYAFSLSRRIKTSGHEPDVSDLASREEQVLIWSLATRTGRRTEYQGSKPQMPALNFPLCLCAVTQIMLFIASLKKWPS